MKKYRSLIAALILVVLLGIGISSKDASQIANGITNFLAPSQPGLYSVTYVNDGDTITVRGTNNLEEKVRFIGLDTPEKNHPSRPVQCYSFAATAHLEKLIGDNDVKLVADPTNTNRDRYDRLLRYVYLPDGTLLNAKMIEDGYGFAYTAFPVTKMDEFMTLEEEARQANRGLWSACDVELDNGYMTTNPI